MKILITILLLIFYGIANGQKLIQDENIQSNYYQALKHASPQLNNFITELRKSHQNEAIIIEYSVDTLNKNQLKHSLNNVIITDVEPDSQRETASNDSPLTMPIPAFARGYILNDTLVINTGLLSPGSETKIYRAKVKTTWNEYNKSEENFRLKLSHAKSRYLQVPVKDLTILLSNTHPKMGEIIYGKITFTTLPYYINDYNFTARHLKQKVRYACYFKIKITNETD